ncbi:RICIN domain-containing protein [Actinacidiphila oryziradicis]|nr:RICIN domain-containing protein [Actinacidiphila oryziradicis]
MPRQQPPAGSGPQPTAGMPPVSIRRAVALPAPSGGPGPGLSSPRGPDQVRGTAVIEGAAVPATASQEARRGEPAQPDPEHSGSAERGAGQPASVREASPSEGPVLTAPTAVIRAPGGGTNGGEAPPPPSGGLRKPLLVAAAVVGALAIAAPFAVAAWGSGKAAHTVEAKVPVVTFTDTHALSEAPSAHATRSPSPSAAPSTKRHGGTKKSTKSTQGEPAAAAQPTPSASPKKTQAGTKPVTAKSPSKAATDRARANAASSATRVLLKNLRTGLCADVPGYGNGQSNGPVRQFTCDGTSADNQLWDLGVADRTGGPQGSSLFIIQNDKDHLCMDLPNYGANAAGTPITEYACDSTTGDNQLWWLVPRSDGTYWIRNYSSGLCLNVAGPGTGGKDANLEIDPCSDSTSDDHHWHFV